MQLKRKSAVAVVLLASLTTASAAHARHVCPVARHETASSSAAPCPAHRNEAPDHPVRDRRPPAERSSDGPRCCRPTVVIAGIPEARVEAPGPTETASVTSSGTLLRVSLADARGEHRFRASSLAPPGGPASRRSHLTVCILQL